MVDQPTGVLSGWKANLTNITACGLVNLCLYAFVQHSLSASDADRELLKAQIISLQEENHKAHAETITAYKQLLGEQRRTSTKVDNVEKAVVPPK